jgi:hypothetical protein
VLAVLLFLAPSVVAIDFVARSPERVHYVKDSLAYHRPAGQTFTKDFEDRPEALRSYPQAPPGYPRITCSLQVDGRGFRNATTNDWADVVVLGDSFAEGSGVSDEHAWPVLLAAQTRLRVVNLAMSGYDPLNYLAALREYGVGLRPRVVLCMLYEGNDFRSVRTDAQRESPSFHERFSTYWKQSPLVQALDNLIIHHLGRVGDGKAVHGGEILDWMPLSLPADAPKYYAFAPKQLTDLMIRSGDFGQGGKWRNTARILGEIRDACTNANCQLVFIYAPTKAHVVFPLVAERLPADSVRAFMALDDKKELPPSGELVGRLVNSADGRESVVQSWCADANVDFLSLTQPLRRASAAGTQTYFTYDQHWTPEGHAVAAQTIAEAPALDAVKRSLPGDSERR